MTPIWLFALRNSGYSWNIMDWATMPHGASTNTTRSHRDPYVVKSIIHSSKVLSSFQTAGEALALREVAVRSGLPKSMAFRLLYTLTKCGLIEKVEGNLYRSCIRPYEEKLYRLGYAGDETTYRFSVDIVQSLKEAAAAERLELICLNGRCNSKTAQRNADLLVREKVHLVIESQGDEELAPVIAAKYREADIPMIAIEIPHPGATYYGANNQEAGLIAGRNLARWAKHNWQGEVDEIILLECRRAGHVPRMRLSSMLLGMRSVLPKMESCPVLYFDGNALFETSFELIRKRLRGTRSRRILIGAMNDVSALGALRAFQEAGRAECCAIMGQHASPEGRAAMRERDTRLVGSVAFFPERYGPELIRVALGILHHRPTPPAIFVKHQLVTPETVDHYYPNDQLRSVACAAG